MENVKTERDLLLDEVIFTIESYEARNPLAQLNVTGAKILINQLRHKTK